MRNFLKDFGQLNSDALDYLKKRLEETNEIILVDVEAEESDDGDGRDELPRQFLTRRHDYAPYRIWKLELKDGVMFAHGYDYEEYGEDVIFSIDDQYLDWSTIIEIADWISND